MFLIHSLGQKLQKRQIHDGPEGSQFSFIFDCLVFNFDSSVSFFDKPALFFDGSVVNFDSSILKCSNLLL